MQITDQRGLEWEIARLGESIIKPRLYMYVQDARQTRWTQVMELTCTRLPPPRITARRVHWKAIHYLCTVHISPLCFSHFVFIRAPREALNVQFSQTRTLLSKQWPIPLLHVDTALMLGSCMAACLPSRHGTTTGNQ